MPNSTITSAYVATAISTSAALLESAMAAVPVDFSLLNVWGLLLDNDVTGLAGETATRTFTLKMVPATNATATSALQTGEKTGVASATVTNPGRLYAVPPIVTFEGIVNGPPEQCCDCASDQAPASAVPVMQIAANDFVLINGGSNYTAPVASLVGGSLVAGGTPAQVSFALTLGAITGVTVIPGGPYITPPVVKITDSTGSGGEVVLGMSVQSIKVTSPGSGYASAPPVVITPYFKAMVPDSANQASIISNWMKSIFENNLKLPVDATTPVVS